MHFNKFLNDFIFIFNRAKAKRLQEAEIEKIKMAALGRVAGHGGQLYMGYFHPTLINDAMHLL